MHNQKFARKFIVLTLLLLFLVVAYLTIESNGNWSFILPLRGKKLAAFLLVGITSAISAISFQTLTQNRILTPSILGLDSLYILFQTAILFLFGSGHQLVANRELNFLISVVLMMLASLFLYAVMFKKRGHNLYFLLLVGMVMGTFFRSTATFMQVLIDPNEFDHLQSKLFASFNNIDSSLLVISCVICLVTLLLIFPELKYLNVLSLGKDQAVNLGVDVSKVTIKILLMIAVFTAIATALVGPLLFLGFLVANIAYQVFQTYRHGILFLGASLIGMIALVGGNLIVEKVFHLQTTLSVVLEFVGGIYFIVLLLKERKGEQ